MRIAIVGSRDYSQLEAVRAFVDSLPKDAVVVSGRGRGVDTAAEMRARERGLQTLIFPADWARHGRQAGFLRNPLIVNACDQLVAFWDGESRGTADTLSLARRANKPIEVFRPVTLLFCPPCDSGFITSSTDRCPKSAGQARPLPPVALSHLGYRERTVSAAELRSAPAAPSLLPLMRTAA